MTDTATRKQKLLHIENVHRPLTDNEVDELENITALERHQKDTLERELLYAALDNIDRRKRYRAYQIRAARRDFWIGLAAIGCLAILALVPIGLLWLDITP